MNGMKPIPLRWVDINKGSETSKEYRSRLVVMETKRRSTIAPEDKGAVLQCHTTLRGRSHVGFTGDEHQGSHRTA